MVRSGDGGVKGWWGDGRWWGSRGWVVGVGVVVV